MPDGLGASKEIPAGGVGEPNASEGMVGSRKLQADPLAAAPVETGFDTGFGATETADVSALLDAPIKTADALREKIVGYIDQLLRFPVTVARSLLVKPQASVAAQLVEPRAFVSEAQQRLTTDVAGRVGAALELAAPLGVALDAEGVTFRPRSAQAVTGAVTGAVLGMRFRAYDRVTRQCHDTAPGERLTPDHIVVGIIGPDGQVTPVPGYETLCAPSEAAPAPAKVTPEEAERAAVGGIVAVPVPTQQIVYDTEAGKSRFIPVGAEPKPTEVPIGEVDQYGKVTRRPGYEGLPLPAAPKEVPQGEVQVEVDKLVKEKKPPTDEVIRGDDAAQREDEREEQRPPGQGLKRIIIPTPFAPDISLDQICPGVFSTQRMETAHEELPRVQEQLSVLAALGNRRFHAARPIKSERKPIGTPLWSCDSFADGVLDLVYINAIVNGGSYGLSNFIDDLFTSSDANFRDMLRRLCSTQNNTLCPGLDASITAALYNLALVSAVNSVSFGPLFPLQQALTASINYHCPSLPPPIDAAMLAYLADAVSYETLACWWRSAGYREEPLPSIVEARRSKLTEQELVLLRRRGTISEADYKAELRRNGWLRTNDPELIEVANRQIPTASDLITMMVRDADDEDIARQFGTDELFEQKFAGQLREWSRWQGIEERHMRYLWRSHWHLPSPTQLFEFWHRLRHERIPENIRVTREEIRDALVMNDYLPHWIDHYLAVSHPPLGRRDARRAFELGALDERGLYEAYQDMGFSDPNAQILLDYSVAARRKQARDHRAVALYARGLLTREEATQLMMHDNFDQELIDHALSLAPILAQQETRSVCYKAIRSRYLSGEFDDLELRSQIQTLGVDQDQVKQLAARLQCEKGARGKRATATMLCRWYSQGLIAIDEFFRRLVNIGWHEADAALHVEECRRRVAKTLESRERQRLREEQREAARREKEAAAAARRQQAQATRRARTAERMRAMQKRRHAALLKIASKLADKTDNEIADMLAELRGQITVAMEGNALTIDELLDVAESVLRDKDVETETDFWRQFHTLAREAAARVDSELSTQSSTNGSVQGPEDG